MMLYVFTRYMFIHHSKYMHTSYSNHTSDNNLLLPRENILPGNIFTYISEFSIFFTIVLILLKTSLISIFVVESKTHTHKNLVET